MKRTFALVVVALLAALPALAQSDTTSAPASSDERIKPLLEELGYTFEIDPDGDYRIVFEFEAEKRTQIAFVNSNTVTYQGLEIREIWSPALKSKGPFTPKVANRLLLASFDAALGAWQTWKLDDGSYMAIFSIKIAAEIEASTLGAVLGAVISVADEMEKELGGADEF